MPKPQNSYFYYDHEACSFVEVQPGRARWVIRAGVAVAVLAVVAATGAFFLSDGYSTPTELAQREEIETLQGQLAGANSRLTTFSEQLDDLAETDRELYRVVLNADPISEDEFQMGVGGTADRRFDRFSAPTAQLLSTSASTFDRLERQVDLQNRSYQELRRIASEREHELAQQPAILPVRGGRLSSGFGMRYHPILHISRLHAGVDFPTPVGTPIYATGDGRISFSGTRSGYGNVVEIDHALANRRTRYAHLSRFVDGVEVGTMVHRGQLIAYSGNTGLSTAPHLHYEVRQLAADGTDTPMDPVTTFVPGVGVREYQRLLDAARAETISFD
ncbi:MAG TPA: M23 family metallopeptidase [Rhodothermales bacterium]|nr:M23 family metallopeptidase [Rhodothermales bacterium]